MFGLLVKRCENCKKEVLGNEVRCAHCKELVKPNLKWSAVKGIILCVMLLAVFLNREPIFNWLVASFFSILPFLFIGYLMFWVINKATFGLFGKALEGFAKIFGGR